jgi:hypothetical protein
MSLILSQKTLSNYLVLTESIYIYTQMHKHTMHGRLLINGTYYLSINYRKHFAALTPMVYLA